jgi:hypothetical protein
VGQVVGGDAINYSLSTTATQFSNVGSYPITVTLGANPNYNVTPADGSLTINQALASVTANNQSKFYGEANPPLDATVVGQAIGGDAINYSLSTTATQFSNVGSYPITVTLGANPNYNVTPADGTLTIDARPLTITASNRSKTYGDSLALGTSAFMTDGGEAPGQTVTAVILTSTGGLAGSTSTAAGSYPNNIVPSAPTGTGGFLASNYAISFVNGKLTVDLRPLTISADSKLKAFGGAAVPFTVSYVTLVSGDTPLSLGGTLTFNFTDSPSTPAGVFTITPSGLTSSNYTITFVSGSLYVLGAPPNVTVNTDPNLCTATVSDAALGAPVPLIPMSTSRAGVPGGNVFPLGTTNVDYSATLGSTTVTVTQTVTVNDSQLPVINLKAPIELWPPDHKYTTIKITDLVTSVTDNCNSSLPLTNIVITRVTSDEPENINGGDGNTLNDMVIAADAKSVQLRAERDGNKNGRVYWIHLRITDAAGNVGTTKAKVSVPKSQGNNGAAVDNGASYQVCVGACPPLLP